MAFTSSYLSLEWEERWRREKERRKRIIEEGGEGAERDKQELRHIVAYNDSKMGLSNVRKQWTPLHGTPHSEQLNEDETVLQCSFKTFPNDVFGILRDFREAGTLTNLSLVLESGHSYMVHTAVVAAISNHIRNNLLGNKNEKMINQLSLSLSPEVDQIGLEAVLEFAYTGVVPSLSKENVGSVLAAAQVLEIPRVLDICGKMSKKQEKDGGPEEELKKTLESINKLRKDKLGCDIVLEVNGAFYHVHKVILAASSDFFRGMFTTGMRESSQSCIELPFLIASELEALIDCSYTGHLQLNWNCVFEIACTALQLQFTPSLSLCYKFMHQQMDANSCLDLISFAEAYVMPELLEDANDFVLRNFWEMSGTAKFLDLPFEKLLDFLKCDGLCAPTELTVFRAVIAWIEANPEERLNQAHSIMSAVRFPMMTFREFREVRAINLRMECKEVELYGSALKEFGLQDPQAKCRVRKPKDVIVLVGGDQLNPDEGQRIASREVWFANSLRSGTGLVKEIEWRKLGEIPDQARFRHGVAAMGGKLFAVGGCYYYTKNDIMRSAYSFDPEQNSWKRLADMNEYRSNFSLVAVDGKLYAIGGDKEINTNVETVEVYDPEKDSWSFTRPLDQALSGQAATVSNGAIFISGGFNCKYQCLVSMFLYHPEGGTTYLSNMSNDRAQHSMEALSGSLYVFGGVCNFQKFYTDQLVCEVYCPGTDSWSVFGNLPMPHVGAPSAVLEDKLYILGGYCQEDYCESGLVHRFDPSMNKWENVGKLPGAVTDLRACLMRLPENLRQDKVRCL